MVCMKAISDANKYIFRRHFCQFLWIQILYVFLILWSRHQRLTFAYYTYYHCLNLIYFQLAFLWCMALLRNIDIKVVMKWTFFLFCDRNFVFFDNHLRKQKFSDFRLWGVKVEDPPNIWSLSKGFLFFKNICIFESNAPQNIGIQVLFVNVAQWVMISCIYLLF